MPAPKAPPSAPTKNPTRRPYFCMSADNHGAVVIEPKTIKEIGIVANAGLGAIIRPASPPTTKIIGICAPRKACARIKTKTLRLAARSSICAVVIGYIHSLAHMATGLGLSAHQV